MAIVGDTNLTLGDWTKRLDPDGQIDMLAELLNATNEVLDDAIVIQGNLPTGHRTTVRSGLPSVAWRMLNYGVQPSKSRTVQVTDSCGMLESYSEVDKSLADLNGNTASFRLSEDVAFIEAMNQEMADTLFYGNTDTDPEKFLGLAARYNDLSAPNATNIVAGDGSGSDNTSIWLVTWSNVTFHLVFPKGSKAGLIFEDKGQVTLTDAAGGRYEGYRTHYKWDVGATLRDWRYVVRICNIDVSNLTKDAATGTDIIEKMITAYYKIPHPGMGKTVWYANSTIAEFLHHQARNTTNVNLSLDTVEGKPVTKCLSIPIKRCDSILNTEATVS